MAAKKTFGDVPSFADLEGTRKRSKTVNENGSVSKNTSVYGSVDNSVVERGNESENAVVDGSVFNSIDKSAFVRLAREKKKEKKVKFEESNTKVNFWIRNDIKEVLDMLCEGKKGEKYRIVNEALTMYLNKMLNDENK